MRWGFAIVSDQVGDECCVFCQPKREAEYYIGGRTVCALHVNAAIDDFLDRRGESVLETRRSIERGRK